MLRIARAAMLGLAVTLGVAACTTIDGGKAPPAGQQAEQGLQKISGALYMERFVDRQVQLESPGEMLIFNKAGGWLYVDPKSAPAAVGEPIRLEGTWRMDGDRVCVVHPGYDNAQCLEFFLDTATGFVKMKSEAGDYWGTATGVITN